MATAKTVQRVEAIHSYLLEEGVKPGVELPRNKVEAFIAKTCGVGLQMARNILKEGELNDKWTIGPNMGRHTGSVTLLVADGDEISDDALAPVPVNA